MLKQTSRCTGQCCENFTLHLSPMEIQHWGKYSRLSRKSERWIDIGKIADMVIFLYEDKMAVNKPVESGEINKTKNKRYHYTCKHLNTVTKNCMNYENRPDTCRQFNSRGRGCTYKGCTNKFEYDNSTSDLEKKMICKKPCEGGVCK